MDDGHELVMLPFINYNRGNLDAVHRMLSHPQRFRLWAMPAPMSARPATPRTRLCPRLLDARPQLGSAQFPLEQWCGS